MITCDSEVCLSKMLQDSVQLFNEALMIFGFGAVIYSDDNDIPVLSGIAFKIFLCFNLRNCLFCRTVILEFNLPCPPQGRLRVLSFPSSVLL